MVSLALLLGCDYCPQGVPGVGKESAMKLIEACKSHDKSCDMLDIMKGWRGGSRCEDMSKVETNIRRYMNVISLYTCQSRSCIQRSQIEVLVLNMLSCIFLPTSNWQSITSFHQWLFQSLSLSLSLSVYLLPLPLPHIILMLLWVLTTHKYILTYTENPWMFLVSLVRLLSMNILYTRTNYLTTSVKCSLGGFLKLS